MGPCSFRRHVCLMATCSSVLLGASSNRALSSQIEVTVINCAQDASIAPSLRLVRWPNAGESPNNLKVQMLLANPTMQPGVFDLSLTEDSANYSIGASTAHCQTRKPTEVPLYAPHPRHVVLAPSASCCSIPEQFPGSIAVSVPRGVWVGLYQISPVRSPRSRFGTLDDDVTYFANVAPGSYEVVVSASGTDACIPLTVPQPIHSSQHYISLDTAELAALFRSKAQCTDAEIYNLHNQNVPNPPTQVLFPLKAGMFTLSIPPNIYQRQTDVKPHFSEFTYYETASTSPLFKLAEGGGAYDLKTFTKLCVNGRQAWRVDDGDSGTVVVGEPGSWVAVSWSGLSEDRLSAVRTIVASMTVNFGPKC